ncbi:hypothetical protein BJ912DRAFT_1142929 [Pholiota molesta]|nr:hypothetical protein BJ912DRAFT_1142929 [Pholiota molesta]
MSFLLNEPAPISRLHRDILWYIFSINSDTLGPPVPSRPWKPPSDLHLSPLTVTRQSSQMTLLETLFLNIENLILPELQGPNPTSFAQPPPVSLPNASSIRICSLSLDMIPEFLDAPSRVLDVNGMYRFLVFQGE